MIKYEKLSKHPRLFQNFTGLRLEAFAQILPSFADCYEADLDERDEENEVNRQLFQQVICNQIPFRSPVNNVWFASAENLNFVVHDLKRHFVMPLKSGCPTDSHHHQRPVQLMWI